MCGIAESSMFAQYTDYSHSIGQCAPRFVWSCSDQVLPYMLILSLYSSKQFAQPKSARLVSTCIRVRWEVYSLFEKRSTLEANAKTFCGVSSTAAKRHRKFGLDSQEGNPIGSPALGAVVNSLSTSAGVCLKYATLERNLQGADVRRLILTQQKVAQRSKIESRVVQNQNSSIGLAPSATVRDRFIT